MALPPSPPSAPGAGGQPSPPMGVSSISGPTPNRGFEAAGLQKVGMAIKLLTDALPMVGATSDIGQDLMKMITKLAKHIPPGAVSPAGERNSIQQMALKNAQNSQDLAAMRAQGGAGGAGGQPPGQPMMPKAA